MGTSATVGSGCTCAGSGLSTNWSCAVRSCERKFSVENWLKAGILGGGALDIEVILRNSRKGSWGRLRRLH